VPDRVLVVEDESLVAMLVEDLLRDLGCEVVGPAATAAQAIALARGRSLDFALLDVNLGEGEDSFGVADLLRGRHVPFAFVTGYGERGVRPDLRDAPVISKPINPRVLERVLKGVR
jgi:CheY-like chemotaxis protein